MIPMMIPPAGWFVIFVIGLPIVLYKGIRDPAWATAGAVYLYFAIPPLEFNAPGFPYQPAFFALATLGALRYYRMFGRWGQEEIIQAGQVVAHEAVALVRGKMIEALTVAGLQAKIRGEIRRLALEASEQEAIELVERRAPSSISVAVRRSVQTALTQAADVGEREVVATQEAQAGKPKGQLHAALQARLPQLVEESLEKSIDDSVRENVVRVVESFEKDQEKAEKYAGLGPLGVPVPRGPLGGILLNPGIWAHLAFMALTYVGAKHALYDTTVAEGRFDTTVLLLPNIIALCASIRNARHFLMFVLAWMFGTWHICMNGVWYWLHFGGRADSAGGQGGEANFLGAIIVAVCPIAFGLALNLKDLRLRLGALGVAGCYVLGVLASGSRAGLLAMLAGLGYWMAMTNRKMIAIGLCFVASACFLVVAPEDFWDRMGTITGQKDTNPWVVNAIEPSKHERIVLWDLAIKIWKQHPVSGIGPMNYPKVSAEETNFVDAYQGQRGLQAHNTWLQLLAEYGIVGGFVWGGAFFYSILCYHLARRRMRNYPGWEWFPTLCLGLEAGALSTAVVISFNSFQWYDYLYWHFVAGPLALEIAKSTAQRLDWLKPADLEERRPPPRYGPPKRDGLDLGEIDLADTSPLSARG